MSSDSSNELKFARGSFRGSVRNSIRRVKSKLVNKLSYKKKSNKLLSVLMAFSALFFIKAHHLDDYHSTTNAAKSSVATSVVRGGAAAAEPSMIKSPRFSIFSRTKQHEPSDIKSVDRTIYNSWDDIRGGGFTKKKKAVSNNNAAMELSEQTSRTILDAISDLRKYMAGPKSDTLFLLMATALITPLCKMAGLSPILGFLASGMLLGPNGAGVISGIHTTETLAELGIVFFLFEMGIELSVERLKSMKKDVFGLGLSQYLISACALGLVAKVVGGLSGPAAVVVGGALSLSSSAFVLQLIKDKKELATRYGKASFGVLLLQDLAVVPLLVATPILAGSGSLASALGSAVVKAGMALSGIALAGRFALNPLFKIVAAAGSQEAFLGVILLTALGMSFLTEGLGLSNTLGAFLAGVLLSETKYRYQIEADIAPFRGILLGLFFVTVGFEIDVGLIGRNLPTVAGIVGGILALKAGILTLLSKGFGLSNSNALRTGLVLSQGGEFAFVAFGLARSVNILDPATTKMLLTCVSLTMALTPALDDLGTKLAKKMEEGAGVLHYTAEDKDASDITEQDSGFVVVVGYGVVGKVVCDLLDRKLIKYVGMEKDPRKAIQARNKGLPVFFGDVGRAEVAEAFKIGKARAVVVTIADQAEATRAVIALRRMYPDKPIFARAKDADHAKRLQTTLDVAAMVPILPEDNVLLTLPFGGAVLRSLGAPAEEVNYILAEKRRQVLSGKELEKYEEEAVMAQLGMETDKDNDDENVVSEKKNEAKEITTEAEVPSKAEINTQPDSATKTEPKKESGATQDESTSPPKKDKDAEMKPLLKQVVAANTSQKKPVEKGIIEEKEPMIDSETREERDEVAA
jgi:monovalent cation:proton antiporter-2 (CPA2) family protein